MTKFSSPTTRAGSGVAKNFKGGIISTFFPVVFFSDFPRTNLKLIKKQERF